MVGIIKSVGTVGHILKWTGISTLVAYFYSKSYGEEGKLAKSLEENVAPVITDVGGRVAKGIYSATTDGIAASTGVQDAVKGTAAVTTQGLNAVGGFLPESGEQVVATASAAASTAGNAAKAGVGFTWNTAHDFVRNILPENTSGWLKAAATIGVLAAGAAGIGSAVGSQTINLGNLGTLGAAPFKFVATSLAGALGPILTGGAVILAALVFLSPTCRQMAVDCFKGIYNMFTGHEKAPSHGQEHAPASAINPENVKRVLPQHQAPQPEQTYTPETVIPPMASVSQPDLKNAVSGLVAKATAPQDVNGNVTPTMLPKDIERPAVASRRSNSTTMPV